MKQKIQITDKNINDIFRLPCVISIRKLICENMDGDFVPHKGTDKFFVDFAFAPEKCCAGKFANVGDYLIEEDDGTWRMEREKPSIKADVIDEDTTK